MTAPCLNLQVFTGGGSNPSISLTLKKFIPIFLSKVGHNSLSNAFHHIDTVCPEQWGQSKLFLKYRQTGLSVLFFYYTFVLSQMSN